MAFNWIYIDIIVFVMVVVIAGFLIPQILLVAYRKNLFDDVDPRKIHKGAVPRLGGIAFFPSILYAVFTVLGLSMLEGNNEIISVFTDNLVPLSFIICSIITLYITGMADDLIGVRYRAKFVTQIFASALMIVGGITLDNLHGFMWIHTLPMGVSVLLTILMTVFITNAINLIDGIDGLASGLSAIACIFYGCICYMTDQYVYSVLAFATLGALVPFFYYNVFGNAEKRNKIFMGDTGSLTVGFILSVLSIRICGTQNVNSQANLDVIAFAPLFIPCCDVVRVYLGRIRQHRNPFLPDKTHIHHKLLALGMSQRVAMPVIIVSSIVFTIINYCLSVYVSVTLLFACDVIVWIAANILLSGAIRRRQLREEIISNPA